jgi:hypothetical protein
MCVDTSAVAAHLAHGDYVGPCDLNKTVTAQDESHHSLNLTLVPNPAKELVKVLFNSETAHSYTIDLVDVFGKRITTYSGNAGEGKNETELDLRNIETGLYMVILILDDKREAKKLVIE